jgi:hypothetical protein
MLTRLLAWSGYDTQLIARLEGAATAWLKLANVWVWGGLLTSSAAVAMLMRECGARWWSALLAAALCLGALAALQAYSTASINASNLDTGPDVAQHKRTRWLVTMLLTAITLVFTQPWVLRIAEQTAGPQSQSSRSLLSRLLDDQAAREIGRIRRDLSEVSELLARLPSSASEAVRAEAPGQALVAGTARADRKALVFGNDRYLHAPTLEGAVRDATAMKQALENLGFKVRLVTDGDRRTMEQAVQDHVSALRPGDISFVHFSGHGFQFRSSNYLAPVDLQLSPDDITPAATGLNLVIDAIRERKPLASIVVIDACRENLAGSAGDGLAAIETGSNTYIAMAAKPGQLAVEVKGAQGGSNGVFTSAILRHIGKPISLDEVFIAVRNDVATISRKIGDTVQETWSSHNLSAPIVLANTPIAQPSPAATKAGLVLPVLRLPDGSTACDVGAADATNPDSLRRDRYTRCLHARLLQLQDDLARGEAALNATLERTRKGEDDADGSVHSVLLDYRAFWSDPVRGLLASSVLLFAMAGGLWWRASLQKVHDAYAMRLFETQRAAVQAFVDTALISVRDFPNAPDIELVRHRFSARLQPRPRATHTDGSLDDLLNRLST